MGKLKTGIFSGSFNPVHIGHLALANYLCEYEGLNEVWFMVSPQNPLKAENELWSDELRIKLVELSIGDYPHFRASDFEFHLPRLLTVFTHWRNYGRCIPNGTFTSLSALTTGPASTAGFSRNELLPKTNY